MKLLIEKITNAKHNSNKGGIKMVITEFLGLGWNYLTDENLAKSIRQEYKKEENQQIVCEIMRF